MIRRASIAASQGADTCRLLPALEASRLQRVGGMKATSPVSTFFPLTRMSALAAIGAFATLLPALAGCAADDEPEPPVPPDYRSTYYRIDRIEVPQSSEEAEAAGLDLDGDGQADNAGGNALAVFQALIETAGEELPRSVQTGLDAGRVDWIIEIGRDTVLPGRAAAALHRAAAGDRDGSYQIGDGVALVGDGRDDGDLLRTDSGDGVVPAAFLADVIGDWPVTWVNGIAVAVALRAPSDGELEGRIAFATRGDFAPVVAGPLAAFMTERLQAGTLEYAADMDADDDGVISEEEFLASDLTQALLGPDVDLLDEDSDPPAFDPGQDGAIDSMSAGFRVHATAVDLE